MAVVNNLKEIRESQGLLQEDLASATGFCTKTIGRVDGVKFFLYIQIFYDN